jgi:hypothetical protein
MVEAMIDGLLRCYTDVRIVPQRTAEMMRAVALSYPGLTVVSLGNPGQRFRHTTDFMREFFVPEGHEAISLHWPYHGSLYPHGLPIEFYEEVDRSLHFTSTILNSRTLSLL